MICIKMESFPKYFILLCFILLFKSIAFCQSQNLVENGNFEVADSCPYHASQLDFCRGWKTAAPTPDYFNCGFAGSVPQSYPHSGTGYIGMLGGIISLLSNVPYNEMVKTKLVTPLVAGKKYIIRFSLGLGHFSLPDDDVDFGLYFFNASNPLPSSIAGACLTQQPQIKVTANQLFQDTYSDFAFCFIPAQAFDSILIGPFCNNNSDTTIEVLKYFMFDDLEIKEYEPPGFFATPVVVCESGYVNFTLSNVVTSASFYWQFENGSPSSSLSNTPPPIHYNQTGSHDVMLIVNDVCTDTVIKPLYITVLEKLHDILAPDTVTICNKEPAELKTVNGVAGLWSNGIFASAIQVKDEGVYYCTVRNECDTLTDSMYVKHSICPCGFLIPNAFTPGSDGINDCLKVYGEGEELHLDIYNRWGEKIYSTTDKNACWNGLSNGTKVIQGVYAYRLKFKNCKSEQENKYGTLTILY